MSRFEKEAKEESLKSYKNFTDDRTPMLLRQNFAGIKRRGTKNYINEIDNFNFNGRRQSKSIFV